MNKSIKKQTFTFETKICTLNELLLKIKRKESRPQTVINKYNVLLDHSLRGLDEAEDCPTYTRKTVLLTNGSIKNKFVESFVNTSNSRTLWMKNLQDLVEEATLEHVSMFGANTHIVRILPRTYIVCDPNDLTIVYNGKKTALLNLTPNRNMVVFVEKMTQAEVEAEVVKIKATLSLKDIIKIKESK